jgi:hypothetical protein
MDQSQTRQMSPPLLVFEGQPFDPTVFNARNQLAARAALPTHGNLLDSF